MLGGLGTRLGAACKGIPKPMVSVAGRPFFEHVLLKLKSQGFRNFLFLVGHFAEKVEQHFGDGGKFISG